MAPVNRRATFFVVVGAFTVAAYIAPAVLLAQAPRSMPSQHDLVLLALALVFTIVALNSSFEFRLGKEKFPFVPDAAALVLAAIYLPPPLAMTICLVASFVDVQLLRGGTPPWKLAINGATSAVALGLTALLIQVYASDELAGMEMLPVTVAAAALLVISRILILAGVIELHSSGQGRTLLRAYVPVAVFETITTSLAVVITIPFISHLWLAFAVMGGFQILMFLAAGVSTSENLHRLKNEYLRDVFSRYVPAHVADQLAESGDEIKLGGEQREISVLFCDIRGFTSWSEHVAPEVVITELNALLGGLSAAVMAADGTLDKYTGDGLMAFWGAPLSQPDHAYRACSAALDMLTRLDACNADRALNDLSPFAIGIGVHSGTAVVGNIGHEDRLDYTAIGDTVNLAARIEASTKDVGSVLLISEATRTQLPDDRQQFCMAMGSVTVKGRIEPVDVHTIASSPRLVEAMGAWTHGDLDIELVEAVQETDENRLVN